MAIIQRRYTSEEGFTDDFEKVRRFLVRINRTNPIGYHFEWGRWEWAFCLPNLDTSRLGDIGIWEEGGTIVGLAAYEDAAGSTYVAWDPDYGFLKERMFEYSIRRLRAADGSLRILIGNDDEEGQAAAVRLGFVPTQDSEANSVLDTESADLDYTLPEGYRIISLTGDTDIRKFNTMLWKGFNHEGPAPESAHDLEERKRQIRAPHLNPALNSIVVAPSGQYASYCGIWYDVETGYALIEPVATMPEYRKLGLGRAAVLNSIRKSAELGATRAYVGSSQQFYYRIGFRPLPAGTFWRLRS